MSRIAVTPPPGTFPGTDGDDLFDVHGATGPGTYALTDPGGIDTLTVLDLFVPGGRDVTMTADTLHITIDMGAGRLFVLDRNGSGGATVERIDTPITTIRSVADPAARDGFTTLAFISGVVEGQGPRLWADAVAMGGRAGFLALTADDDVLDMSGVGSAAQRLVYGGDGNDLIVLARRGSNFALGGDGDDRLTGSGGAADTLSGNAGQDRLFGQGGSDVVEGGDGRDRLFGGEDKDDLKGDAHADVLFGGRAGDVLFGGIADDRLFGGAGRDALIDGQGQDVMTGGDGGDVFRFSLDGSGSDTITDFVIGQDRIILLDFTDLDVSISDDGTDAQVTLNATGQEITLAGLNAFAVGLALDDIFRLEPPP